MRERDGNGGGGGLPRQRLGAPPAAHRHGRSVWCCFTTDLGPAAPSPSLKELTSSGTRAERRMRSGGQINSTSDRKIKGVKRDHRGLTSGPGWSSLLSQCSFCIKLL